MKKNNYLTVIDFGSSELRLGVFDNHSSKLFFETKDISKNDNYEEYSKSINTLVREAEKKISTHLENITVLYDNSEICTVDLSIKKKIDQKSIFKDVCSSLILEAEQLIKNFYTNKKVIHIIINKYIINGKVFLKIPPETPNDLSSVILDIKFICLPYNKFNNVCEIFKKNNLNVLNFFLSSLVKSFNYIDYFKQNKFVAFLDIGLDRTTIIFFINQKLDCLNSIPIGGNHISRDISQIMKLSFEESEELKKSFNKSEIDFSYDNSDSNDNKNIVKKILGKNISIDLIKKVVLARIEEIIQLSFNSLSIFRNIETQKNLNLVLIGRGSKIFNKNSFQMEDKYNFKEINFYEENEHDICKAGLMFKNNFHHENLQKFKKNQKKIGIFHRFFNIFGNG